MSTVRLCRRPIGGFGEVRLYADGPDKKPSAQEAAVGTLMALGKSAGSSSFHISMDD
jgi:hypothetical protein